MSNIQELGITDELAVAFMSIAVHPDVFYLMLEGEQIGRLFELEVVGPEGVHPAFTEMTKPYSKFIQMYRELELLPKTAAVIGMMVDIGKQIGFPLAKRWMEKRREDGKL